MVERTSVAGISVDQCGQKVSFPKALSRVRRNVYCRIDRRPYAELGTLRDSGSRIAMACCRGSDHNADHLSGPINARNPGEVITAKILIF